MQPDDEELIVYLPPCRTQVRPSQAPAVLPIPASSHPACSPSHAVELQLLLSPSYTTPKARPHRECPTILAEIITCPLPVRPTQETIRIGLELLNERNAACGHPIIPIPSSAKRGRSLEATERRAKQRKRTSAGNHHVKAASARPVSAIAERATTF
jgi:hypothetical protein